ncbi:MAG: UDP-N-acetylmuramoyl-L-alanyl-D-glutamate--2,6-diaminopimelate ligase [Actinobacteria bacterium HGW-Actinobacteria-1]|jgi:UDP-N-acetylmuramoyl-L-alanyl-D-glutamate--2,6-diaminopimelate ligase|nr:MAG: UDP-N-acetylmuramoyl-L-alanyl-D-glutamate--2,6-diaminopimelate ligase [Actinobacteria bacterium HGW-Actinobacteria-1]
MDTTTLSALLNDIEMTSMTGAETPVSGVAYRAADVRPGDAFFCIPGFQHDGHEFAPDAANRGAVAIVSERPIDVGLPNAVVGNTRSALAHASAHIHGYPSRHLGIVGVTGTNGKTTTTYLLDSIMRAAGRVTGVIGTVETRVAGERQVASRTTPESADLQALFARMRDAGVTGVAMEVSSHAIDLHRVDGTHFAVAAFTNLTQDHLDYHHTLEEYWSVKRRLFTELDVEARVINVDDAAGAELAASLTDAITVGRSAAAFVRAVNEQPGPSSTRFTLIAGDASRVLTLPLAGAYNVENALVAAGSALALGIGLDDVVVGLESAPQVPGRLERIDEGQPFTVLVDYAHTPDSLAKAISAVRAVTEGKVIVVFGCGGDRDPDKRPLMGRAASEGADTLIITSDNPRSEDPVGIILQVEDGVRQAGGAADVEVDRRKAIARAVCAARPGDAVLIAGKGHEDYQIFADRTVHFDDREVAAEELRSLC